MKSLKIKKKLNVSNNAGKIKLYYVLPQKSGELLIMLGLVMFDAREREKMVIICGCGSRVCRWRK